MKFKYTRLGRVRPDIYFPTNIRDMHITLSCNLLVLTYSLDVVATDGMD